MLKKTRLKYQPEWTFLLIGISSHENDYHLSWTINKEIGLKLIRVKDLIIPRVNENEDQHFSVFSYDQQDVHLLYNLISNTGENGFLIPEFKNIDFFLQIYGGSGETFEQQILENLKRIGIISACFIISPEQLKSPGKLLFT